MPALLPKPGWAAFSTKGELSSSPVLHSQFPWSTSPRGCGPGQGYPWDPGLCYTQSLGEDIERVQPQKVLEYSCSVHSRGAHFFSVLQYPSSWKHGHTGDYVVIPSFLCTAYGHMLGHTLANSVTVMYKSSQGCFKKGGLCLSFLAAGMSL